ncbi:bifunctional glutamate N-acetyltransferase/amino-acid acetyltransferase ArgJ [Clostridium sp. SHJSY1]|uniref:bifunctional glutamate N-acetyltransferase/amino-acid acetyltransferase ArgJ n=1 Tax=Clostridium sp. SHJSY1 TaxID=2942483 RepID=UPI0028751792|nr:bifunctional glutamate N-acetyltransferase/amino-acid acetyltransferase ArgJ [Clostridium sp. SHJSY1]MDS0528223.1 bifunctional glutamate N-acetyltransferase/amino-acid acetyltransferase ArgJ [Clostridium sp. SHJSY1]
MNINVIEGGVTAPQGFLASGIHCGLKKNKASKDLALIFSEKLASAAGVFTSNKVKGAPIYISKEHLSNGIAQAVIINSGNANTCNGDDGLGKAKTMATAEAMALKIPSDDVLVASTGVIGVPLNIETIEKNIPKLTESLSKEGFKDASEAIMTTDTVKKELAISIKIGDKTITLGSMAKGSGMIEPNMCTMLAFITTDINISPALLKEALKDSADISFNRISVDGDQSTNDTLFILANGLAGNDEIREKNEDYYAFLEALKYISINLAKKMAQDGEGATKLLECKIIGACSEDDALLLSKSVINSSLVKTAMFGCDANWGRILCALGYSGVDFDPDKVNVCFESLAGSIIVCKNGSSVNFDEDEALKILKEKEILIKVELSMGDYEVSTWGCDLSYDYVKINGDYRS